MKPIFVLDKLSRDLSSVSDQKYLSNLFTLYFVLNGSQNLVLSIKAYYLENVGEERWKVSPTRERLLLVPYSKREGFGHGNHSGGGRLR